MRKFPYKTWLLAALLLLPWTVQAAGLGSLNVLSSLGQPLQAEIDLISADKDELSSMSVRLASPEAYTDANIPYSSALVGVRMSIEKRADGQPYIKITSISAVNDPFIDFLIELSWTQGKLVRQYTALIDPPGFTLPGVAAPPMAVAPPAAPVTGTKPIAPAPVAASPTAVPPATAPAESQAPAEAAATKPEENKTAETPVTAEAKPEEAEPVVNSETPAAKPAPSEYTVKHGDTLYRIAVDTKPEGVTVEQMLVSLYRSNPKAFVGNMSRMKARKILRIPEQDKITEVTQSAALKEVRVQTANWNAYRRALAEAAAATPAPEEEKSATSGKINTKVEEPTVASNTPQEVLKLSKGETADNAGSPQDRMHAMEEEATAREKALAEANDRVTLLEKQIKDMQHLLDLKGVKAPAPLAPVEMPLMKPETPASAPSVAATPVAPTAITTAAVPSLPSVPKKPKIVEPPPGLMDEILSQPLYLAGAGGALVLLGGIGYLVTRRRQPADRGDGKKPGVKKNAPQLARSATDPIITGSSGATPAAVMSQTVAMPAIVDDDVDPLQEADLYLNFGRDAQAEEVLKEALEKNPKLEEAHLKLLQIYAGRKDKAAFEKSARKLKELTGDKGANWLKAAALGYGFDPGNTLYEAGKSASPAAAAPAAAIDLDFDVDVASRTMASKTSNIELEAGPNNTTTLLQPGVAAQAEIEDITHDSAGGGGSLVPDITFDAPIEAADGTATDVALESGGAPVNMIDFSLDTLPAGDDKKFVPDQTMAMNLNKQGKAAGTGMDLDVGTAKETASLAPDLKLDFGDAMTAPPPAMKLTGINLNLDEIMPPQSEGSGKDEQWSDMQTKFDLAKAYQEMGDKDGAREVLKDVIKQGDATQQEEAKKLLESLG